MSTFSSFYKKNTLLLALISGLFFCISLYPIIDTDFGWHIKVGKFIFEQRHLPKTDITSYSLPDFEYNYHSWLSELILYLINRYGGMISVSFFYSVLTTMGFLLVIKTTTTPNLFLKCLYLSFFIIPFKSLFGTGLRIQTLTFFLTALLLYGLRHIEKKQKLSGAAWLIPLIFPLWVNLHGGFIIGIGILGLWFLGEILDNVGDLGKKHLRNYIKQIFLLLIFSVLATLINPYFIRSYSFTTSMLLNTASNDFNPDWYPVYSQHNMDQTVFIGVSLTLCMMTLISKRTKEKEKIILGLLLILSLSSARFLLPLLVYFLPILLKIFFDRKIFLQSKGLSLYLTATLFLPLPWLGSLSVNSFISTYKSPNLVHPLIVDELAGGAMTYMEHNQLPGEILNDFNWGGYLQWRFPHLQVFVDGKMDNYYLKDGSPFTMEYLALIKTEPGWEEKLKSYNINTVITYPQHPIIRELKKKNWTINYEDEKVSILTNPKHSGKYLDLRTN